MKCVWINPLVDRPQMKKLPNNNQNAPLVRTSRSALNAVRIGWVDLLGAT